MRSGAIARSRASRPGPAISPFSIPARAAAASAIDVTAAISQLRSTCQDAGDDVVSTVTFTVTGLRRDLGPERAG